MEAYYYSGSAEEGSLRPPLVLIIVATIIAFVEPVPRPYLAGYECIAPADPRIYHFLKKIIQMNV